MAKVQISIAATIGAVGVLTFDACFPDSLVGITPNPDQINSDFLYWQLRFIQSHLESVAPYAAQKNINLRILRRLKLWAPSMEKQEEITHQLDSVWTEVAALKRVEEVMTAEMERLEQSILARAFRGEL
jgi:type I restriction enzyme S subunit